MATIEKYTTADGSTRYRVRYRTPDKRSTQKRGFTTKRDAEQWANKLEVAKMVGEYVAPSAGKVTIGELGPAWLARQRGHLKASTMLSYELSWTTHVADHWGPVPISRVYHSDVQAWIADLSSRRGRRW